jgi:hypothetical protein
MSDYGNGAPPARPSEPIPGRPQGASPAPIQMIYLYNFHSFTARDISTHCRCRNPILPLSTGQVITPDFGCPRSLWAFWSMEPQNLSCWQFTHTPYASPAFSFIRYPGYL